MLKDQAEKVPTHIAKNYVWESIIKEEIERRIAQGRQQGLREAMECVPEKDSTCCVMCDETRASLTELLEK